MQIQNKKITPRTFFILFSLIVLYITLIIYLFYIQIINGNYFLKLSNNNYYKIRKVFAPRGDILDITGEKIVTFKKQFRLILMIKNKKKTNDIIENIKETLNIDSNILLTRIRQDHFAIIKVFNDTKELNFWKTNNLIEENTLIEEFWPRFNIHNSCNHITGYIRYDYLINKEEPTKGIEKAYNNILKGNNVEKKIFIDTNRNVIKIQEDNNIIAGKNLNTTLFLKGFLFLEELFKNYKGGGVVVLNDKGQVLINFSTPYLYVYEDLYRKDNYFLNKTLQEKYPAGSIFKLISVLTLWSQKIPINNKIVCTGSTQIGNRIFHCWKRTGHGLISGTADAIKYSCNIFFYHHCYQSGIFIDDFFNILDECGFNYCTQQEIKEEINSKIKKPNSKIQMMLMSIGQGYTTTTIMQNCIMMARLMSTKKIIPTFNKNNNQKFNSINLQSDHLEKIQEHILGTFSPGGTCSNLNIPNRNFFGKTSTAQVMSLNTNGNSYRKEHSIFVGGEKTHNLYISVLVENAGFGSKTAGVIATKLLDFIIKNLYET